jgi:hypothetical protein
VRSHSTTSVAPATDSGIERRQLVIADPVQVGSVAQEKLG